MYIHSQNSVKKPKRADSLHFSQEAGPSSGSSVGDSGVTKKWNQPAVSKQNDSNSKYIFFYNL